VNAVRQEHNLRHLALAREEEGNPLLARFSRLAAELGVVLPVPFFEKADNTFYNSVVIFDSDGARLGKYRKASMHFQDDERMRRVR
jgi:N-carbamoylputrescine amidase